MLTRILHNSEALCAFIDQLDMQLSQPQRRHIENMADALLVCGDEKTLAGLQQQFVEAPDASNIADFLRISPWEAQTVRCALRTNQVAWLLAEAERRGLPKFITINIDDSLGEKHKQTRHLEPVDWHYDHVESTKRRPRYKNGICYLVCTLRIGDLTVTVDLRLYLRAVTVRRINRRRPQEERIPFFSKYRLARSILVELKALLPKAWQVYVQFDSWYASAKSRMACHLRSQSQPQAQRQMPRPTRLCTQTPALHPCACGRCRWVPGHSLCAADLRPPGRCTLRHPRLLLQKASQGAIPGVLHVYGSHSLGPSGLAGLSQAVVVRGRQLLPQDASGLDRLPGALLRGGGQIYRCRSLGLGLCGTSLRLRALRSDQDLRRHHSATSGRTCARLANRRFAHVAGYRRYPASPPSLPAPSTIASLALLFVPALTSWVGQPLPTHLCSRASRRMPIQTTYLRSHSIFANVQFLRWSRSD
ncbi:MAG: transposase [Caldilineaceae bacterium]|nr:transposase [Caldilineaceae bacterium]